MIEERYSLSAVLPEMVRLYEDAVAAGVPDVVVGE